jgi:hypothetical protein
MQILSVIFTIAMVLFTSCEKDSIVPMDNMQPTEMVAQYSKDGPAPSISETGRKKSTSGTTTLVVGDNQVFSSSSIPTDYYSPPICYASINTSESYSTGSNSYEVAAISGQDGNLYISGVEMPYPGEEFSARVKLKSGMPETLASLHYKNVTRSSGWYVCEQTDINVSDGWVQLKSEAAGYVSRGHIGARDWAITDEFELWINLNPSTGNVCNAYIDDIEFQNITDKTWCYPLGPNAPVDDCAVHPITETFYMPRDLSNYDWTVPSGGTLISGGDGYDFATIRFNSAAAHDVQAKGYVSGSWSLTKSVIFTTKGKSTAPDITVAQNGIFEYAPGNLGSVGIVMSVPSTYTYRDWYELQGNGSFTSTSSNPTAWKPDNFGDYVVGGDFAKSGECPIAKGTLITILPEIPDITGYDEQDAYTNETYSVPSGYDEYSWVVTGACGSIDSGQGTRSIVVTPACSGSMTVKCKVKGDVYWTDYAVKAVTVW